MSSRFGRCRFACAVLVLQAVLSGTVLAETFTVRGTVTDAGSGAPAAEARVELLPLVTAYDWGRNLLAGRVRPEPAAKAVTDAAGRFALEAPSDGLWSVVVRARGRVPLQLDPLLVVAPVELPPAVLVRSRTVKLEVRDGAGAPAAGALVFTFNQDPPARDGAGGPWKVLSRHKVADAEGRLVVARRTDETLRILAMAPGAAPVELRDVERGTTVGLPAGPGAGERRILTVRHADGSAAGGVLVNTGVRSLPTAVTGDDGTAALGFPLTEAVELRFVTAAGHRHAATFPAGATSFEVRLPAPQDTAGQVVDVDGRVPLAGTWVWPSLEPALAVRADGRGRYALPAFERGSYLLLAARPGYLVTRHRLGWLGGRPPRPTLALEPAAALSGRVVDVGGAAVADAELRAVATTDVARRSVVSGRPPSGRTRSGADGTFYVGQLRPGEEYALVARHPDFAPAELRLSGLEPRRTRGDLRLVLDAGRTVVGRTVDLEGQAVAGVTVVLDRAGERPPDPRRERRDHPFTTASDGDGTFGFGHVPTGDADLSLTASGFAPAVLRGVEIPAGAEAEAVDLGEVRLEPAVEVAGRAVDADGNGLDAVSVRRLDSDMGLEAFVSHGISPASLPEVATSDADGRFTVGDLRRGERFHLVLTREGYRPGALEAVEASGTSSKVHEVVLERAASIRGRVVDTDGRGLPGASVQAATADPAATEGPASEVFARPSASARSDPAGEFHLEVPPGVTHLSAELDGYILGRVTGLRAEVGRELDGVELVLERGVVVEGRVTAGGEPVDGARVAIGDGAALTDADGRYRAEGVPTGRQQAQVYHLRYDFYEEWVEIPAEGRVLDLELAAAASVSGRVVGGDGAGRGGVRVHLLSEAGRRISSVLSDPDGSFLLAAVPAGRYALEASAPGLATVFLPGLVVRGESLTGIELRLDDGVTVRGRITGLGAGELAEVRVLAQRGDEDRYGRVSSTGEYTLENLAPDDWKVSAELPGGERKVTVHRRLDPQDPESLRIDLDFGTGLVLTGEVFLGDTRLVGQDLAGANLTLRGLDVAASRRVMCDHEGSFRVEDLEPGRYRLQVTSGRLRISHSEDFVLDGDRHLQIELGAARLAGRVSDAASGAPLESAQVLLERLSADVVAFSTGVPSDKEGRFVVPRLTPGSYRLRVNKKGYASYDGTLETRAGEDRDDLEVALEPVGGVEVVVRLSSGGVPNRVTVGLLDGAGGTRTVARRMLDGTGRARVDTLPAGTWDLIVLAPDAATTILRAEVAGDRPLELVLEPAGRLDVHVPALSGAKRVASLELRDASGRLFRDLGDYELLTSSFPVVAGSASLATVPPGLWSLRITDAEGQVWSREVVTTAGQVTRVRFE